jgi:engulfment/cell motility protein 1
MCVLLPAWHLFSADTFYVDSTSTTFQPFFLNFYKVHTLALNFSLRMWNESGAATDDFPRVIALARSQYVLFTFSRIIVLTVYIE